MSKSRCLRSDVCGGEACGVDQGARPADRPCAWRMTAAEKDEARGLFKERRDPASLFATTVIEVGVDVPDATDHRHRACRAFRPRPASPVALAASAWRRGLDLPSALQGPLSENGRARLNIMRETEDGFLIAEEDLKLRGEGETSGDRQSGTPGFSSGKPRGAWRPAGDGAQGCGLYPDQGPEP